MMTSEILWKLIQSGTSQSVYFFQKRPMELQHLDVYSF